MRICFVTGEYPPMEGGVGAFTRELAHALRDLGHEPHIVTTRSNGTPGACDERGLVVHRKIARWNRQGIRDTLLTLRGIAPDVVNLQYEIAAYGMKAQICRLPQTLRRQVGAPLAVTFHDLLPPYLFPKAGRLRQRVVWQLAQQADGVITTNAEDQNTLEPKVRSRGKPARRIPIGSNISTEVAAGYDRERYRAGYGWQPDDLVIGFFGFMNRSKGIETLLHAVALLRDRRQDAHLLLIGGRTGTSDVTNAPYAEEIDALIESLGLASHIWRTGFATQQAVSAALRAIDVCALPYRDGANLRRGTLHAALTHGCPVITTTPEVPISELKDGVNIIFVSPEDPGALAGQIHRVGLDRSLRSQLGRGALDIAKRFSWPRIAAETAEFLKTLC